MEADEKKCPACAEIVKTDAKVCKHCGLNFETGRLPGQAAAAPVKTKPTGPSVGKVLGIIALVIVGLIVLGAVFGGGDKTATTTAGADQQSAATPPVEVSARNLEAAYAANEAAAQKQYGGKPLLVSATIKSIDLGLGDEPYLVLVGSNEFMGPQAHLDDVSQAKAGSLSKGQKVSLLCQDVSEIMSMPMLKDCAIQ